jgi:acyl-coenzyme A thioesterase PaaI-like protein
VKLGAGLFRHGLNLWPPFLATGIHVTDLSADWRHARVDLRLRPWTRNAVGTHFGGSLFAMTDPFWMLLVMRSLGPGYYVWDREATIDFRRPGRGVVHARFDLDDATLAMLRDASAGGEKVLHWFETPVVDASGETVAHVRKRIYVRRKPAR